MPPTETPLAMMLWMDSQYAHPSALPACLGDSYLYGLNPVFRGVRDLAISLGVTYKCEADPLVRDYGIAPLLVLPRILETGVVPYFPTAELLRTLSASHPNTKILADEIRLVKPNYLMHESAHVAADRLLLPLNLDPVLHAVLGESFANAVEAAAAVYAIQPPHKTMYSINSYMSGILEERGVLLRALVAAYGFEKVFETALWIFFFLNVKPDTDQPGPRYLEFVANAVFGAESAADPVKSLLISAGPTVFGLSKGFRGGTTPLHFRLRKLDAQYAALRDLDFETAEISAIGVQDGVRVLTTAAGAFST